MKLEAKTLDEWIDFYETKTGDKVQRNNKSRHLFYLPKRGFCELSIEQTDNALWVHGVVGDGEFWYDFALMEADGQGLSKIKTYTYRDINVLFRIYGGRNNYINDKGQLCCHDRQGRLIVAEKANDREWFIIVHTRPNENYESDGKKLC